MTITNILISSIAIIIALLYALWEHHQLEKQRQNHKQKLDELNKLGQQAVEEARKPKNP